MIESRNFLRFISFLGLIIGILVVVGLLLSSTCRAQQYDPQKSLTIFGFKGLNTAGGVFNTPPDYTTTSVNIDYSRFGANTIGKRSGFDSVRTFPGIDSIVGLGTYQKANRQSCLVFAVDDSTKGYGAIYATPYGSDRPDSATKIKDYWSIQNPTRFSQFNDNLYAANGQQQGMVWDGTRARSFPLNAPGMFDIIPLNTSGNLNGEYRYCIHTITVYSGVTGHIVYTGGISPPVYVKNGQVLLRGFTRVITDSTMTSVDSAFAYIGRTKANPGALDGLDSIYKVSSTKVWLKYGSNYAADTVTFTDNATDASLVGAPVFSFKEVGFRYGRDSLKALNERRYGAPTFLSSDTANASTVWRITFGAAENAGYAYMVTLTDTLSGLESDSSRVLFIGQKRYAVGDSAKTAKRFTIGLPKFNVSDSNFVVNVYRASQRITVRPFIVVSSSRPGGDTIFTTDQPSRLGQTDIYTYNGKLVRGRGVSTDSALTVDFYLAATVPLSQSTFVDSIRCDSLWARGRRFNLSTQPEIFSQIFQWRSKLGGVAGSRIWFSSMFVDSQGNFGTNDFDDFNRNDGDFITAIGEAQWGLKVKKNRAGYVLPNGGGRPEKVSSFGCVAPLSFISSDVGDLFVGDGGVYLETEGQALERVYNAGLVSEKLSNFVNMPDSVRRTISAFWLPDKRQAIFSADYPATANDTAFVLDFRAGQIWTTWTNMVPRFGCLYSRNSTLGSPPPQTFYFTKAGGKILYKYGTSDYDVSTSVMAPVVYETPRLFPDANYEQVDAIGLVVRGMLITADSVSLIVYDQHGSNASTTIVYDSLSYIEGTSQTATGPRFSYKEVDAKPSLSPYVKLFTGSNNRQLLRGAIEAIEILYRRVEKVSTK